MATVQAFTLVFFPDFTNALAFCLRLPFSGTVVSCFWFLPTWRPLHMCYFFLQVLLTVYNINIFTVISVLGNRLKNSGAGSTPPPPHIDIYYITSVMN